MRRTLLLLALSSPACLSSQSTAAPATPASDPSPSVSPAPEPRDPAASPSTGQRAALPVATPDPAADRIACFFAWRRDATVAFRPADKRAPTLSRASAHEAFTLGDFDVDVARSTASDGALLRLSVGTAEVAVHEAYDFSGATAPANLPASGHGFTGLRYLTHPKTKSELQYACAAVRPGESLADDTLVQQRPGPAAPATSAVSCQLEHISASGSVEAIEPIADVTRAAGSTGTRSSATPRSAGGFVFLARYAPDEHEASALTFDVTWAGGAVRDLYQLRGADRPSNLFGGAGFTGTREIEDKRGGARLRYRCQTATP